MNRSSQFQRSEQFQYGGDIRYFLEVVIPGRAQQGVRCDGEAMRTAFADKADHQAFRFRQCADLYRLLRFRIGLQRCLGESVRDGKGVVMTAWDSVVCSDFLWTALVVHEGAGSLASRCALSAMPGHRSIIG